MIAFHVVNEDGDFTCSFHICKDDIVFDQAYKAWNKRLTDSEMQFAKIFRKICCRISFLKSS